jgi:NAD(P)-dependent dehydrogenase (short-subunit alcohol dehydrogenase family)
VSTRVSSECVILVAGGATGISEACADAFVERGATVVLFDRDRPSLEATAERLGTRHWVCDVSDEASVRVAAHAMLDKRSTPAGLLHSAGITQPMAGPEVATAADFSHVVSVDLLGTFLIIQGRSSRFADPAGTRTSLLRAGQNSRRAAIPVGMGKLTLRQEASE